MNISAFKIQVAAPVAAKIGITRQQASLIVGHVAQLSTTRAKAMTVQIPKLGAVVLSSRMVPVAGQAGTLKASEAVAKFKVGNTLKTVAVRNFGSAGLRAPVSYALTAGGNAIRVSCALEGDQDTVPPRDSSTKS